MIPRELPSVEYLKECFLYKRSEGKLFWKQRPTKHFASEQAAKVWNDKYVGREAFHEDKKRGYRNGSLNGQLVYTHRVIWKLHTKKEPPKNIDHKDRNKRNNIKNNLRAATHAQNAVNSEKANGVVYEEKRNKWMAYTKINRRMFNIGRFNSRLEAVAARYGALRVLHRNFVP